MENFVAPSSVSDYFLAESRERGEVLTNLKLQKLLYYAQAWHLALHDKPLFDEEFQAWVHGPVLPSQYGRFRQFQWKPITSDVNRPADLKDETERFLSEIVDVFGSETAVSLELMTHRERPWLDARGSLPPDAQSTNVIPKTSMQEFYRALGAY